MKELLERDQDFVRAALEAEMTEAIGAEKENRRRRECRISAAITAAC